MAFIKEEDEEMNLKIEETFSLKLEDDEEQRKMAFIKDESENLRIEEVFSVKHEESEEQTVLEDLDFPEDLEYDSESNIDSCEEDAFLQGIDPVTENESSDEELQPHCLRKKTKSQAPSTSRSLRPSTSRSPCPSTLKSAPPSHSSTSMPQTSKPTKAGQKRSSSAVSSVGEVGMWHSLSDEDEAPPMPIFAPKRPPGPQLITDELYSPIQLFQLFFSNSVVLKIIANTNAYAEKMSNSGKKFKWQTLTLNEFHGYLSLLIYMGLVKVSQLSDYWSKKLGYNFSFPSSVMSRDRFLFISWSLHLCDLQGDEENQQKKGTDEYDPLYKVKPLYTDLITACKTFYQPNQHLSIDETMVATKAHIPLKQYMKTKSTTWGYKLFDLADSVTGYTWNFSGYAGKRTTPSDKGLSHDVVMSLLDFPLLGTGYTLFVDNFYTSPDLFKDLAGLQMGACGTIRTNRKGFPHSRGNDMPKNAERGTIRWTRKDGLLFVKWMDTREVVMCSSVHKAYGGNNVNRKVKVDQGEWTRRVFPIPEPVFEFNKYMGGVDLSDSLIGYYNVLHKTRKWYKKMFQHLLDIAVVNAFILHKEQMKAKYLLPLTQKEFREQLMQELLDAAQEGKTQHQPSPTCMPEYAEKNSTQGRRRCVKCHQKTPVSCTKCNVSLCFVPSRNCFQDWHVNPKN